MDSLDTMFIGCCLPDLTTVKQPRRKPKPNSIPTLRINRNREEARLDIEPIGEQHAESTMNIIQSLFEKSPPKIKTFMKVRNTREKATRFEREGEAQECSLEEAGPCSMADLNVVWRFYGVPVSCSLGSIGSGRPTLCDSEQCGLCRVLIEGKGIKGGVLTTTSRMALKYVGDVRVRKAVILCKVVAGRVDLASYEEQDGGTSRFNSCVNSKAKVLYVRNSNAVLPTFVVFY